MTVDEIKDYCRSKKMITEENPFGDVPICFKLKLLYTDVTIAVKNGFKSFFTGRLCKELSVSYVLYEEI